MIVSDVTALARVLLNDVGDQLYHDSVLLPFVQQAYREAQKELTLNNIQVTNEISSVLPIASGDNPELDETDIADLILPLSLSERAQGSSEQFISMTKTDWEPEIDKTDTLLFWNWRENAIKFRGANTNREVKVKYRKSLPALETGSSLIRINDCLDFMAAKTAAIAASVIGGNQTRAGIFDGKAKSDLSIITSLEIKATQQLPARRKPFRAFNR